MKEDEGKRVLNAAGVLIDQDINRLGLTRSEFAKTLGTRRQNLEHFMHEAPPKNPKFLIDLAASMGADPKQLSALAQGTIASISLSPKAIEGAKPARGSTATVVDLLRVEADRLSAEERKHFASLVSGYILRPSDALAGAIRGLLENRIAEAKRKQATGN